MSNQSKAIVIQPAGAGFTVAIPGEALRQKEQALAKAATIQQVTNAEEQEAAIQAAALLKGLSQGVERTREEVKKPYLDAGRAIDAKAKEYRADIDARISVIENLIGVFQRQEREKAEAARREEERKRQEAEAEQRREQERAAQAERDRLAAEKAAQEAETRRVQAELDAAEAKTKAEKQRAAAAQAKAEAEARAADEARKAAEIAAMQAEIDAAEAQDAAAEANATSAVVEPPKAFGVSIREKVEFEVTNIEQFYAWDLERRLKHAMDGGGVLPTFVKMEIKKGEFGQFINVMDDAFLKTIPGVKFTVSTKAATRSIPASLTLK